MRFCCIYPSNPTSYQPVLAQHSPALTSTNPYCLTILYTNSTLIVANSFELKYSQKTVATCFWCWFSQWTYPRNHTRYQHCMHTTLQHFITLLLTTLYTEFDVPNRQFDRIRPIKQVPRLFLGMCVLHLPQQSCHWPVVSAQHSPELISPASDHSSPNLTSRIANSIEFDLWNRWKNWFHDFFECVSAAYTPSNPTSYQQCVPNTLQHLLALHTPCLVISRIRRWIVTNLLPLKYIEKTVLTCFLGWFSHAPTPGIIQGTSSVWPAHSSTS